MSVETTPYRSRRTDHRSSVHLWNLPPSDSASRQHRVGSDSAEKQARADSRRLAQAHAARSSRPLHSVSSARLRQQTADSSQQPASQQPAASSQQQHGLARRLIHTNAIASGNLLVLSCAQCSMLSACPPSIIAVHAQRPRSGSTRLRT